MPGVVHPAHPRRERPAAVGEADPQRPVDPVEHPTEHHGQDGQVGLGGHADQPLGHPAPQPGRVGQVPRVDEHRRAHRRAVLEERDDALVVEVAVADVVADLDARVSGGQAPVQLRAGGVGVLQGNLAERDEPLRRTGTDLQGEVVEDPGDLRGVRPAVLVAEEHRRRRHHLLGDPVGVHVRDPHGRVPAVALDPAELPRAHHDHRVPFGVDPQPGRVGPGQLRPASGNVVAVHVDSGFHGVDQPLPGCSVPHCGQVRACSLP